MEQMYQDYKDIAEFRIVYIREAHAADSTWPVSYAKTKGIKQPTSFNQRCEIAEKLVKDKKLTIPFIIDDMDNSTNAAYQAWPDRVYAVRKDGRLAIAGNRGPWGFAPALKQTQEWLAEYKKTGKEPPIAETDSESGTKAADKSGG